MHKPPVAFFVFNRPDCTRRVFEEIRRYQPEKLLLVADGPRPSVATDDARCKEVRAIVGSVDWPCEVKQNFAEQNLGCKKRVSSGLDWVFSQVEEAIILEDDCVPGADFFGFCAELLSRYRTEPSVAIISGDNFQNGIVRGKASYYFSRFAHIWGWASWRRAWRYYDVSLSSWPEAKVNGWLKKIGLDRDESTYWTNIFDRVHAGQINTWDYQWVYACWQQQGLGIIPNVNLVTNIGASADATHTKAPEGSLEIPAGAMPRIKHPGEISRNIAADRYTFEEHYGGRSLRNTTTLTRRARNKLGRFKRMIFG